LPERPEDDDEQLGSLRPTAPVTLAAWGVAGLAIGWLVHPVTERINDTAPVVSWAQPLALFLVAAILGVTAHATWRSVHVRRERLEPHRAVNRLVLARACALAGALVGAGYLGYALSWLGSGAELADDRMVRSAVAAVGGLATVVTALLLERACRVRNRPDPA
jgi:predicted small integral membrane protein